MKGKKPLIALAVLLFLGLVGVTFAYFTSKETFDNKFTITGGYNTLIKEEFTAPDEWLPGQKVAKDVLVTNKGSIDVAVRLKMTEIWPTGLNGTEVVTLEDSTTETINIVEISLLNTDKWVLKADGYYYYQDILAKDENTAKFMDGVTLNSKLSVDSAYLGKEYTLRLEVETIQADGAVDGWGIDASYIAGLSS